jgi:hypothetical protein
VSFIVEKAVKKYRGVRVNGDFGRFFARNRPLKKIFPMPLSAEEDVRATAGREASATSSTKNIMR